MLFSWTKSGEIQAFLNSCSHRGVHLCTADFKKKKRSHAHIMDGVTIQTENLLELLPVIKFLGKRWIKSNGLYTPIPQIGSYHGLIFRTLDPDAVPLEEYLGDLKWYLDIFIRHSGGMEIEESTPLDYSSKLEKYNGEFYWGYLSCANITSINC